MIGEAEGLPCCMNTIITDWMSPFIKPLHPVSGIHPFSAIIYFTEKRVGF